MAFVRVVLFALLASLAFGAVHSAAQDQAVREAPTVVVARIEGVIGPPAAQFIEKAIRAAAERQAEALILELNTPGGLETSMRDIAEDILRAPVPVIGYVSPSGARAASAGTFILYATHIAVMAPGTNIGAATPINLGGEETPAPEAGKEKSAPAPAGAGERKAINDAAAFIRSLAEMRGRNAHWGERAVRGGEAISAREALRLGVIDFIAADRDDLLRMLDGRAVTAGGAARTLHTRGASVDVVQPSTIARLLGVLVNPNVAFLLMLIGFYGLVFEFANPGLVAPGVIGAMCLVLGLYALNQLPLNYAGLALVLLGLGFVIAEAFTPTFGVLGIAGALGLLLGAAMLIDTDIPQYRLSWGVILGAAAMSGAFAALVVGSAVRAHRRRVATGPDAMIGRSVEVLDWAGGAGHVMAQGERWRAIGPDALSPGRKARVVKVDGLTVHVTNNGNQGESP